MVISISELYSIFIKHPVVSTDTRTLPEGCIFFALKGENFNANAFAVEALKRGAAYAVVDEIHETDERLLLVSDVLTALQDLATHHRKQLTIPVIGITGSNGKTTTKELIASVLKEKFNTYYTQGNFNNHIGVPLTILAINKSHEIAVVEMGANHQKEIEFLCKITQPNFGLITNIGKAHLEGFGGIEGVKKGKGELYDFLIANNALIFIQQGEPLLTDALKGYMHTVSYGTSNNADCCGTAETGKEYLEVKIQKPFSTVIQTQLTGAYNLSNVLSAVSIGVYFGLSAEEIKKGIENYVPGNQRSQVIVKDKLHIIIDAYNANPSSMTEALTNLKNSFTGEKIIALGEMLELGEYATDEHDKIAELVNTINAKEVILVGANFQMQAAKYNYHYFSDSSAAAIWLKDHLPITGTLLIKGSRGSKMEKLLDSF